MTRVDRRRHLAQMQKRVSRARDANRRRGSALAAQRAVFDRAPCSDRRMMELILGQQGPLEQIAATRGPLQPAHIVTRTWCDRDLLRRPFRTYRPSPGPFAPRSSRRSRRSSRRGSRSGPRKFEKLYVDVADELGRRPIGRRVAAAPRAAARIIRGRTAAAPKTTRRRRRSRCM